MYKVLMMSMLLVLGSVNAVAHEDHDKAPGAIKANHGGTVKPGKEINLEYKMEGAVVKLFPASHDGKDLTETEVKLTATTQLPKGKIEPAAVKFAEGGFQTDVQFKGAYRVEMVVVTMVNGKKDTFKFQVEK